MNLEKVLRYVVIGGAFLLPFIPLIVTSSLFFPFITGKNFTFRILVEIMAAAWLALALIYPQYRPRRSWMLAAFAIFVLIIGIADVFGANAFKSIWSNFERMEGWVTLAHLLAYFTIVVSVLKSEKLWNRFALVSIGVSVLIGLYGLFQLAGFITINQGGDRLDATFGNAIYLAVYMLFHLFLTALVWARVWVTQPTRRAWMSALLGAVMLLQGFTLLLSESRGAILGVFVGAFITAVVLVILARRSRVAWRVSTAVVGGMLVFGGLFFLVKDQQWVHEIGGPVARIASISLDETTIKSRLMNAQMAWQGFQDRPILGWGQENYNLVFNTYYNPGLAGQEPWFDRTHNVVFDWLIAGGLLGFLAYASLFAIALWYLWFTGVFTIAERSIFTGMLSAYGFNQLTVFDNIVSYLLFFSVLAYITVRVTEAQGSRVLFERLALPSRAFPFAAVAGVLLAWGLVYGINAHALAANRTLIQAIIPQEAGVERNLALFEEAIAYDSYGTQEIREQLLQGAVRLAGAEGATPEALRPIFEAAEREMRLQIEEAPLDARHPFLLGVLFNAYGMHEAAKEQFENALALSPTKVQILMYLGINEVSAGDTEEAVGFFQQAHELNPEYDEARVLYAVALIEVGEQARADEILESLLGKQPDPRIISAYVEDRQYGKVAELWRTYIDRSPSNPTQAYFSLSASYYAAGRIADAIAALEELKEVEPSATQQANEFIRQIQSGTVNLQ